MSFCSSSGGVRVLCFLRSSARFGLDRIVQFRFLERNSYICWDHSGGFWPHSLGRGGMLSRTSAN
jgi:hypothetical protein